MVIYGLLYGALFTECNQFESHFRSNEYESVLSSTFLHAISTNTRIVDIQRALKFQQDWKNRC